MQGVEHALATFSAEVPAKEKKIESSVRKKIKYKTAPQYQFNYNSNTVDYHILTSFS